jgi:Flp pilus assembly protein TadB
MDTHRRPPVIDMTPEGEFRDADTPRAAGPLDRALARIGAAGVLVAFVAGGLVLAGLAILAIGILLPIALVAGAVGAGSLWWRMRRARRDGTQPPGVRFVIIRR